MFLEQKEQGRMISEEGDNQIMGGFFSGLDHIPHIMEVSESFQPGKQGGQVCILSGSTLNTDVKLDMMGLRLAQQQGDQLTGCSNSLERVTEAWNRNRGEGNSWRSVQPV